MFDDFRQNLDDKSFEEEPEELSAEDLDLAFNEPQRHFLGMTAPQRLVIAVMFLLMTCMLGAFCLLVTGRIFPPFLG